MRKSALVAYFGKSSAVEISKAGTTVVDGEGDYEEVESSRILDVSVKFEDDYFYKKSSESRSRKRQRQFFQGRVETGYYIAVQGVKQKRQYV